MKEEIINEVVYVSPRPSGPVNFFEHFDDEDSFKTTWVKSSAKKEGVDEDIAKYDGRFLLLSLLNIQPLFIISHARSCAR